MSHDFRSVVALQFAHAAALARALKTLKSHDVFGGIPVSESNARDIGICFLPEILKGKCPVVNSDIKTIEGLDHKRDQVTFLEGESPCIEAFNVIIMDHSARVTLSRALDTFKLETNKDVHDLLWSDDRGTKFSLEQAGNKKAKREGTNMPETLLPAHPEHLLGCGCENCEDLRND